MLRRPSHGTGSLYVACFTLHGRCRSGCCITQSGISRSCRYHMVRRGSAPRYPQRAARAPLGNMEDEFGARVQGARRSRGRCGLVLGRCGRGGGVGGRAQSVKARQRREPAQRNPREVVVVQDAGGRHGLGEIYYSNSPPPTSEYLRAVPSEPTAVSRFARLCETAEMSASTRRRCVRARTVFVAAVVQRARSENSHS